VGSKTFNYTGGWQSWTVPAGVTSITVYMNGAGSGLRRGGRVEGKLSVTPGKKLYLVCGGAGKGGSSGGTGGGGSFGGGGTGGDGKSGAGGDGGGGFSEIRRDSTSGTIVAVAGGAGGDSGDNGAGGAGGGSTGASGGRGTSGSGSTGAATGGTQTQGGNGGTSSSGSEFNGHSAPDTAVSTAGAGGEADHYSYGGGGGGGGWRSGGGGQAASKGYAPGGGGGGGSNYTGGMTSTKTIQSYATGNGVVSLLWTDPAPANLPPTVPTSAQVNGITASAGLPTKDYGDITISAIVNDPDSGDTVRMLVRLSVNDFATYGDYYTGYVARGARASVVIHNHGQNLHYKARLYSQDNHNLFSTTYNSIDYFTNRSPLAPQLLQPAENVSIPSINSTVFTWVHIDPDPTDAQKGFELRYRTAASASVAAGAWTTITQTNNPYATWTINPNTFRGNTFYEWTVRTSDVTGGLYGEWAQVNSFFASSVSTPPTLVSPSKDQARDVHAAIPFVWQFVDPDQGDSQNRADIRYRVLGQDDTAWVTLLGAAAPGTPGASTTWTLPPDTFVPGYQYEWQVRTYDTVGTGVASGWSASGTFWGIGTPGELALGPPIADSPFIQGALGCGEYRAFIYAQGGMRVIGEITPMTDLNFKRVRDDISNCLIHSNGFGQDCCALYASLRCWMHEIVVFRDGVRVWEGPITRIGYTVDSVEIEAKDVMGYLYRRVMRQGYNDSYQTVPGSEVDPKERIVLPVLNVVERAERIIINALAPYDPNVLPYLTSIKFSDDAKQSRVVPDFNQTAWEQVDDLAATAGLDYTVIGRRIILWDTHRLLGKLPEMRDGDFSDPPVVTEYGMQTCNYMVVTNNSGVYAAARPVHETTPFQSYGPIEMVASDYAGSDAATDDVLTAEARQDLIDNLTDQARRNIDDRWPTPVIVRVPDNSTLNPAIAVGFDQLVPGVWIPLRSTATCREVVQWQKLDSVTVNVDAGGGEKVQVVMSPAPNGGDPDADAAAEAD